MAKVWTPSDHGFVNSKGEIGIWVDDGTPSKPVAQRPAKPAQSAVSTPVQQSNPYQSYLDKMMAIQQQQLAAERERQARIRQGRIDNANRVYDTSIGNLNNARDNSLREAYIKYMKDSRALPQQMQVFGVSGGATETNFANMKNAYGNNRTDIMNKALEQQRLLEQEKANAIAAADADAANYEANAVREYNNNLINMYASALNSMPKYSNVKGGGSSKPSSNIRNNQWYKLASDILKDGGTRDDVIEYLDRNNVSENLIDAILNDWDSSF